MNLIYYFFTLIGSLIVGFFIHTIFLIYEKKYSDDNSFHFDKILIDNLLQPIITISVVIGAIIGTRFLSLTRFEINWYFNIISLVLAVSLGFFFDSFGKDIIDNYFLPHAKETDTNVDNIAFDLLRRVWSFVVISFMMILVLIVFGMPLTNVVFIYIVLLVIMLLFYWDKIENMFSYIDIRVNQLYYVGDIVSVLGHYGVVDKIDLEYTTIEKSSGSVVMIPNKIMSHVLIEKVK